MTAAWPSVPGGDALLAVGLAGLAGGFLPGRGGRPLSRIAPTGHPRPTGSSASLWVAVGAAIPVAMLLAGPVPVLLGVVLAGVARRAVRRRTERFAAQRRRAAMADLLAGLVAELRAGADPRPAIAAAAQGLAGLERVAAAARSPSGDVPRALAQVAAQPGGGAAADLIAAWRVAELTGAGLAGPADRVLAGHRAQERLRLEIAAQLAAPAATARLLSGLPVLGVGMGIALGADPVGFLTGTAAGRLCLVLGVLLVAGGRSWTRSITRSAAAFTAGEG